MYCYFGSVVQHIGFLKLNDKREAEVQTVPYQVMRVGITSLFTHSRPPSPPPILGDQSNWLHSCF